MMSPQIYLFSYTALAKVVLPLPLSPAMVVMVAGFSAIVKLSTKDTKEH